MKKIFKNCVILCLLLSLININYGDLAVSQTYAATIKSIRLNIKSKSIAKEESFKLQVQGTRASDSVTFSASNTDVVEITPQRNSKSCKIKGIAVGKSIIYATVQRDDEIVKVLKCSVNVTPAAISVRFRKSEITITKDELYDLMDIITLKPKNTAETPTFSVSDDSILKISKDGIITPLEVGSTQITATILNGKSDTITVNVKKSDD
ncbi:MAG: Ig-like domain-containing protein [Lachnospiraceae bacterium]|nr:Ig-like domain-containing protein [Lachnospiraceae bacterium]